MILIDVVFLNMSCVVWIVCVKGDVMINCMLRFLIFLCVLMVWWCFKFVSGVLNIMGLLLFGLKIVLNCD